jgi:hypothetical protein
MMKSFFALLSQWSVLSLLIFWAVPVTSLPVAVRRQSPFDALLQAFTQFLNGIQTSILNDVDEILPLPAGKYTITQNSPTPVQRAAAIAVKQATFLYGPPVAGGPFFPSGPLGLQRVALDQAFLQEDLVPELGLAVADATAAVAGLPKVGIRRLRFTFATHSYIYSTMGCKRFETTPSSTMENGRELFQEDQTLASRPITPRTFCSQWSACLSVRTRCADSFLGQTLALFKSMMPQRRQYPG